MPFPLWSGEQSRRIITRVVVEGDLVLQTAAHFGNGDGDDLTDMPLLLDPLDEAHGKETPLLTGASIAGALRSYLRARERGHQTPLPERHQQQAIDRERTSAAVKLFGGFKGDDDGEQSPLIVDDVRGRDSGIEIREGVSIRPDSRTARNDQLFNLEVWQAGTTFPLRFELVIREDDDAPTLKGVLVTALAGLTDGGITLGARKRRGYGCVNVTQWRVKEYDLTEVDGLCGWIDHGGEALAPHCAVTNLQTALGVPQALNDARRSFTIKATFSLDGSLLIRSGSGRDDTGPDTVHLHSVRANSQRNAEGKPIPEPILSGTSFGGALRARALKIANTLGPSKATGLIGQMFGHTEQASKVSVSEQVVRNATTDLVQNRVSIDRFTGGARDTALFNEQPAFGDEDTLITAQIQLINPEKHEIGLLLLLLKDLWTSDLPLGGESSVGRGRLKGRSATLTYRNGSAPQTWTITANGNNLSVSNDRAALDEYVKTDLKDYFNQHTQEMAQ